MKKIKISALILAAGASTRMGKAKQLLKLQNDYLLERTIKNVLAVDFDHVYTVIGHQSEEIKAAVKINETRFQWVITPNYLQGQSRSLKEGLREASKRYQHVMVFLGDVPFISQQTVQSVYEYGLKLINETNEPFSLRPIFDQKPGHPVLIGYFQQTPFEALSGDQGAKLLLAKIKQYKLQVDDPGILLDIDTPEAYQKALVYQKN